MSAAFFKKTTHGAIWTKKIKKYSRRPQNNQIFTLILPKYDVFYWLEQNKLTFKLTKPKSGDFYADWTKIT